MERNYRTSSEYHTESEKDRYLKEEAYLRAQRKVKKVKGFYIHLIVYLLVNIFLIGIIGVFSGYSNIWVFGNFLTPFFWGIGVIFHALGVFGPNLVFGKEWEDRKIKEYMDKENKRWE